MLLATSVKTTDYNSYQYCNSLKAENPKGFKALEWSASVEAKKNTKCVDLSLEKAKNLTTTFNYGFFLGLQSGGLNDAEIDIEARKLINGESLDKLKQYIEQQDTPD